LKVVVTGANGWLGRSSLWSLSRMVEINEILAVTRNKSEIEVDSIIFKPINYSELECLDYQVDGYIHLPFITRDKVEKFNNDSYLQQNKEIIQKAEHIIKLLKPKWVISISSGAVYKNGNNLSQELEIDSHKNPYGYLKHSEEKMIKETTSEMNANYVIGRLWGATGKDIQNYKPFALGDFISSALRQENINVTSTSNIKRNFVDSRQFMTILIKEAISGNNLVIDSFGNEISVRELAKKVGEMFPDSTVTIPQEFYSAESDHYLPPRDEFLQLFAKWGIPKKNIEEQISDTVLGVQDIMRREGNLIDK
jgi:nucleoside-diphosphate-sugar epimerase